MFHRRNASDAAIGWISTVDSLLLGFGLMLVLALHSAMTRSNVQVVADQAAKQLEVEAEARKRLAKENQEWKQKIEGLEMQSSRLREQLAAGVQGVDGINNKLEEAIQERDKLKKQKAADEDKVATALAELEDARKQRDEAKILVTSDGKERDSLRAQIDEMAERLKSQIAEKDQEVADLRNSLEKNAQDLSTLKAKQSEADRLLKQALGDVTKYRTQAGEVGRKLIAKQAEYEAISKRQKALEASQATLGNKLAEAETNIQRGRQLQSQLDAKSRELDLLQKRLKETLDARALAETRFRNEASDKGQAAANDVLGFKGQFKNVVFIIDISESMLQVIGPANRDARGNADPRQRWNKTKREIVSWARHLPMDSLRLVVFHSNVFEYPGGGKFFSMKGDDRAEAVRVLEKGLNNVVPNYQTNTLAAFRKAYSYPGVDTMILFTDGKPFLEGSDQPALIAEVQRLVRQHRDVPVNVVGIGEYFEKSFADFLRDIADTTGGEFIGR
jgi:hypothetical protein